MSLLRTKQSDRSWTRCLMHVTVFLLLLLGAEMLCTHMKRINKQSLLRLFDWNDKNILKYIYFKYYY